MTANYKFIDHTADIACEVLGDTLELQKCENILGQLKSFPVTNYKLNY